MERKKLRKTMISTGKYGKIVRSIKAQPRSPLPVTANKHMIETGIELQGTFASEIQKEGKVIGWTSDDNQTQAIIKDETIEIRIGQDEWKTTKSHWNEALMEALRDEKLLQHNNISIKTTKRTLICSTDDSTMVDKHLTESYTEWFAPHGEE
jgi:hypothetical protein